MPSYNKLILIGHLTRDPEVRATQNGKQVCSGGIAVNEKRGEHESVMFIDWAAFGKTGETMAKHLKKGSAVLLEGKLEFHQWDDKKSGTKRSKHQMMVFQFTFVGGKAHGGGGDSGDEPDSQRPPVSLTGGDIPF